MEIILERKLVDSGCFRRSIFSVPVREKKRCSFEGGLAEDWVLRKCSPAFACEA